MRAQSRVHDGRRKRRRVLEILLRARSFKVDRHSKVILRAVRQSHGLDNSITNIQHSPLARKDAFRQSIASRPPEHAKRLVMSSAMEQHRQIVVLSAIRIVVAVHPYGTHAHAFGHIHAYRAREHMREHNNLWFTSPRHRLLHARDVIIEIAFDEPLCLLASFEELIYRRCAQFVGARKLVDFTLTGTKYEQETFFVKDPNENILEIKTLTDNPE